MKLIKSLLLYVVICSALSVIIYYFTENLVYSAFIWVAYGAGLVIGIITDLLFSKLLSPLHSNALASIFVYLTVGLLVGGVDYYFMVPAIQGAVEYPFPLSFSIPLWILYGILLLLYLTTFYIRNRSCPACRGITLRRAGYCHLCGFSQGKSISDTAEAVILQGSLETSAALDDSSGTGKDGLPG